MQENKTFKQIEPEFSFPQKKKSSLVNDDGNLPSILDSIPRKIVPEHSFKPKTTELPEVMKSLPRRTTEAHDDQTVLGVPVPELRKTVQQQSDERRRNAFEELQRGIAGRMGILPSQVAKTRLQSTLSRERKAIANQRMNEMLKPAGMTTDLEKEIGRLSPDAQRIARTLLSREGQEDNTVQIFIIHTQVIAEAQKIKARLMRDLGDNVFGKTPLGGMLGKDSAIVSQDKMTIFRRKQDGMNANAVEVVIPMREIASGTVRIRVDDDFVKKTVTAGARFFGKKATLVATVIINNIRTGDEFQLMEVEDPEEFVRKVILLAEETSKEESAKSNIHGILKDSPHLLAISNSQ